MLSYEELVSEYAVHHLVNKHRTEKGENSRPLGADWSPQDPMAKHQPEITTNHHGLHTPRPIYD